MASRRVGECVFNRLLMLVAKRFAISKAKGLKHYQQQAHVKLVGDLAA